MSSNVGEYHPQSYSAHFNAPDESSRLDIRAVSLGDGSGSFQTIAETTPEPGTGAWEWTLDRAFRTLKAPSTGDDHEAFMLSSRDGIPDRYSQPGKYADIVNHLGFDYQETTTRGRQLAQTTLTFNMPSLAYTDKKAAEILLPTSQNYVLSEGGVYKARTYFEALAEGERLVPADPVWGTHDRGTHELGERASGPSHIELRRKVAKKLLDHYARNPDDELLRKVMYRDDFFTDMLTYYVTRSNGDNNIPAHGRTVESAFAWYWSGDSFSRLYATTDIASPIEATPRKGEAYPPVIMDSAREVRQGLSNAAKTLGAIYV